MEASSSAAALLGFFIMHILLSAEPTGSDEKPAVALLPPIHTIKTVDNANWRKSEIGKWGSDARLRTGAARDSGRIFLRRCTAIQLHELGDGRVFLRRPLCDDGPWKVPKFR